MYSYFGISQETREVFDALELELRRPIALYPRISRDRMVFTAESLVESRERLGMPHLTRQQAAELGVIVVFDPNQPSTALPGRQLAGIPVNWLKPTVDPEFPFSLPDDDVALGYVTPRTVVCLVDYLPYLHQESGVDADEHAAIWQVIADAVRTSVGDDIEQRFEQAKRERLRERVAEMVRQNHHHAIAERRESITHQESQVRQYEENLRNTLSALRRSSEEMELLLRMQEGDTGESLVEEYDKIARHPRVRALDLIDDKLVITTDDVTMTHPLTDATRWLGRFKFQVSLNRASVTCTNLDNPRHGRDHPHVSSGSPCFGGHERQFNELIVQGRWSVFLELMFQYLETFNPRDDWGRYAAYWFDSPDRDPSQPQPEEDRDVGDALLQDTNGQLVYEGDLVSFHDEDGHDARGTVVAVATPAEGLHTSLPYAVQRDDDRTGGGAGGAWLMEDASHVTLMRRAVAAV